ncbi:hypothetical protein [Guptibacillus algicola]|uniref:hypothetical protein n=1 Tax=Guptibacillus algicola TaxID=225844 RepID=UPI001CD6963B|nr:hypothetical protein [Alkalihalobacillus algicola]MCA0987411.1 hypothetical protein [Alkalihalobacillus algicola]
MDVNIGDILFQLFSFIILLSIPALIIVLIFVLKGRKSRMDRLEEKIDLLISQKEEK